MTHEEAALFLTEHAEGRLSEPTRSQVEEHAGSCAECEAVLRSYRLLAEGFRADAGQEAAVSPTHGHPTIEELVDLGLGCGPRAEAIRAKLAGHLATCTACAREVEAVRAAQAEAAYHPPSAAARAGWRAAFSLRTALPASLAAGIAVLIMAYPSYLGLSELPKVRGRAEALVAESRVTEGRLQNMARDLGRIEEQRRRIASWSGAIVVPLLSAPVRGGALEEITIPVGQNQPFVCLVTDPGVPQRETGAGDYAFRILDPDGAPVWSVSLAPPEVHRQLSQAGSLAFLIPSENLPPGHYRLRIVREKPQGGAPSFDIPFAVVKGD